MSKQDAKIENLLEQLLVAFKLLASQHAMLTEEVRRALDRFPELRKWPRNPHPKGSYLWAKEEHERGRDVARGGGSIGTAIGADDDWAYLEFSHGDFIADDWFVKEQDD